MGHFKAHGSYDVKTLSWCEQKWTGSVRSKVE